MVTMGGKTESLKTVAREAALRWPTGSGSKFDLDAFVVEMGKKHSDLSPDTIEALTRGASELDTLARAALCKRFQIG